MAAKHSRHIALTAPLAFQVNTQVAQGRYASASEMVRVALRLLIEQDEAKKPDPSATGRQVFDEA